MRIVMSHAGVLQLALLIAFMAAVGLSDPATSTPELSKSSTISAEATVTGSSSVSGGTFSLSTSNEMTVTSSRSTSGATITGSVSEEGTVTFSRDSPTVTEEASATGSLSPEASLSRTSTISDSISEEATPTISRSLVATFTSSESEEETASVTVTPPPTPSRTATITDSLEPTKTLTTSKSSPPTNTKSLSVTITPPPTPTLSESRSESSEATLSVTESGASTASDTFTAEQTASTSITLTDATNTAVATRTFTETYSTTASGETPSPSFTGEASVSATSSLAQTATESMIATVSMTFSDSPTATDEATQSLSQSHTFSAEATLTESPSESASGGTPSRSLALTPSQSVLLTASSTLVPTASVTISGERTASDSESRSSSVSGTASTSPSATVTITESGNASVTASVAATASFSTTASVQPTTSPTLPLTETPGPTTTHPLTASSSHSWTTSISGTVSGTLSSSLPTTASLTLLATPSFSESATLTISTSASATTTPSLPHTASETMTASFSSTTSQTQSFSRSATLSFSASVSHSTTWSQSASMTQSTSLTESASITLSTTISPPPTFTQSITASLSLTSTRSVTDSRTVSPPPTATPTATSTPSDSLSRSISSSSSASSSPSASRSKSGSPSATVSLSYPTPTISPPPTPSPTFEQTLSISLSTSWSISESASHTGSWTAENTMSISTSLTVPTASPSSTRESSQTLTLTQTGSIGSPSSSASAAETGSVSLSASGESTESVTITPPPTPTPTHTLTIDPPPTGTATFTDDATMSGTVSSSDSAATPSMTQSIPPTSSITGEATMSESLSLTETDSMSITAEGTSSVSTTSEVTESASSTRTLPETKTSTLSVTESLTTTTSVTPPPTPTPSASASEEVTLSQTRTLVATGSDTITPPPTPTRTFTRTWSHSDSISDATATHLATASFYSFTTSQSGTLLPTETPSSSLSRPTIEVAHPRFIPRREGGHQGDPFGDSGPGSDPAESELVHYPRIFADSIRRGGRVETRALVFQVTGDHFNTDKAAADTDGPGAFFFRHITIDATRAPSMASRLWRVFTTASVSSNASRLSITFQPDNAYTAERAEIITVAFSRRVLTMEIAPAVARFEVVVMPSSVSAPDPNAPTLAPGTVTRPPTPPTTVSEAATAGVEGATTGTVVLASTVSGLVSAHHLGRTVPQLSIARCGGIFTRLSIIEHPLQLSVRVSDEPNSAEIAHFIGALTMNLALGCGLLLVHLAVALATHLRQRSKRRQEAAAATREGVRLASLGGLTLATAMKAAHFPSKTLVALILYPACVKAAMAVFFFSKDTVTLLVAVMCLAPWIAGVCGAAYLILGPAFSARFAKDQAHAEVMNTTTTAHWSPSHVAAATSVEGGGRRPANPDAIMLEIGDEPDAGYGGEFLPQFVDLHGDDVYSTVASSSVPPPPPPLRRHRGSNHPRNFDRRFNADHLDEDSDDEHAESAGALCWSCRHGAARAAKFWLLPRGEWHDASLPKVRGFVSRFGNFFEDFRAPHRSFLLVELGTSTVTGAADGFAVATRQCTSSAVVVLIALAAFLAAIVWRRPYNTRFNNPFFAMVVCIQVVLAAVAVHSTTARDDEEAFRTLEAMSIWLQIMLLLRAIADFVTWCWSKAKGSRRSEDITADVPPKAVDTASASTRSSKRRGAYNWDGNRGPGSGLSQSESAEELGQQQPRRLVVSDQLGPEMKYRFAGTTALPPETSRLHAHANHSQPKWVRPSPEPAPSPGGLLVLPPQSPPYSPAATSYSPPAFHPPLPLSEVHPHWLSSVLEDRAWPLEGGGGAPTSRPFSVSLGDMAHPPTAHEPSVLRGGEERIGDRGVSTDRVLQSEFFTLGVRLDAEEAPSSPAFGEAANPQHADFDPDDLL